MSKNKTPGAATKRILQIILPPVFLAGLLLLALPQQQAQVRRETPVFGTFAVITINGMPEQQAAAAIGAAFGHFRAMHKRFHPWQPGELHNINDALKNNALPISISAEMATMITLAADHSQRGEYLFNPAIGGLVSLWGFHGGGKRQPPDDKTIAAFAADMPSLAAMTIRGGRIIAAHPKTKLDFGAIAKGVALDAARDILRANGVKNALINVGGNLLAMGDNNGKEWMAGLSNGDKVFGKVALRDGESLAVSGGGEQNFVYQGRKYHHIINPQTGYPATTAALAAVISNDATNAGALSDSCATALVIANEKQASRILNNCQTKAALRIIQTPTQTTTITTPPMQTRLHQ